MRGPPSLSSSPGEERGGEEGRGGGQLAHGLGGRGSIRLPSLFRHAQNEMRMRGMVIKKDPPLANDCNFVAPLLNVFPPGFKYLARSLVPIEICLLPFEGAP